MDFGFSIAMLNQRVYIEYRGIPMMAMEGAGAGLSLCKTALVTEPATFHTVPQDSSGNISAGNLVGPCGEMNVK